MPSCSIETIDVRSPVNLRHWKAFEVRSNSQGAPWALHVSGFALEDQNAQVSPPIEAFDPESACCRSADGTVYRLIGASWVNEDVECTWNRWKAAASVTQERDVSQALSDAILTASSAGWTPAPRDNLHVMRAREILRNWSEDWFDTWWNNRSSFLGARRPRDILATEPELVIAAAQDQYDSYEYCG